MISLNLGLKKGSVRPDGELVYRKFTHHEGCERESRQMLGAAMPPTAKVRHRNGNHIFSTKINKN